MTDKNDPNYGRGEVTVEENDSLSPALRVIRGRIKETVSAQTFDIPLLPGVATQVLQMANNPKAGLDDLEKLVKQDQVIAAKILQVSNSPFYRGISTIVSLRDAMNRMGLTTMKDIVFSLSVKGKVFQARGFEKELENIWQHSVACAVISQMIAKKVGIDGEYSFLAGLLHDIGKVVLIQILAQLEEEERQKKVKEMKTLSKPFDPKSFKIDQLHDVLAPVVFQEYHAAVGAFVATKWKLPSLISQVIQFHHEYAKSEDARSITTVVYLGNILCHHFGYGHEETPIEYMNEKAFFELSLSVDQIKKLFDDIPAAVDALQTAL
ncbi:MAG: signal transduction protein [Bacteriovoracaceae bacterium]|nr:signal transduction protein [Bacteriovoracaceae bacterium]